MRILRRLHRHGEENGRRFAHGPHGGPEHGGRGFGRGERFGRGGRLARFLEHGDLKMLVLHLIHETPRHGYEVIKAIEELAGGAYAPSPGVVYPTLTLLEELGQVTCTVEGARKLYTITEAGTAALAENRAAVDAILARIAAAPPRENASSVLRAMENLGNVLRMKFRGGAVPQELTRKIVETLDAVARSIEEM